LYCGLELIVIIALLTILLKLEDDKELKRR